jgi:pimeloyl-ACP methyl ester carboxylesterase
MADDIAALIDHLELDRPDLVGYSLGGGVALYNRKEVPGQGQSARRDLTEAPARRYLPGDARPQQGQVNAAAAEFMRTRRCTSSTSGSRPVPGTFRYCWTRSAP